MTVDEFEVLKGRIEKAKAEKARAEGALERINQQLRDEFGVGTPAEIVAKLAELDELITVSEERRDALMADLEKLADWKTLA